MELIEKMARGIWNCNFHPDDVADGEAERRISDWPEDWAQAMRQAQAALTALIKHAGGDGVTEGDRDAAKSLLGRDDAGPSWWSIDSGNADNDRLVQAFARHRVTAFAAGKAARERAIVAWLREDADTLEREDTTWNAAYLAEAIRECADAIERGEV